jgi:Predicted transcriptional regulators
MNLGDRIQYLRKSQGISQEELAYKIGVSRQAVSKWESEQSLPDIDRIIAMSELFEVTTDYLLNGIELEMKGNKLLCARDWALIGSVLNFIGFLFTCFIWYERQETFAFAVGFSLIALGCLFFGLGLNGTKVHDQENAKRIFWLINVWIITFLILSLAYNLFFTGFLAPYPLIYGDYPSRYAYILFWILYFAFCIAITLVVTKRYSSRKGA